MSFHTKGRFDPPGPGMIEDPNDPTKERHITADDLWNQPSPTRKVAEAEWLLQVTQHDAAYLLERDKTYGSSWRKRGGIGAFMMLARKWDRLETVLEKHHFDIFFGALELPTVLNDLRDLRRYLLLVETHLHELHPDKMTFDDPNKP